MLLTSEFTPGDPRWSANPRIGAPGVYAATCMLSVPGHEAFRGDVDVKELLLSGDSLLKVAPSVRSARFDVEEISGPGAIELTAHPNVHARIGSLTFRFQATSFEDARAQAYNQVSSLLSWLAYRYNVALEIGAWQLVEESTQSTEWQVGLLGQERPLEVRNGISKVPYRRALAAYREGLNTTGPFYAALCFYKVVTYAGGLRRHRRASALSSIRDPADERFPTDVADGLYAGEFGEFLAIYAGRSFGDVRDDLRETVRNALAHLEIDNDDAISADRYEDVQRCERAVPVLRHMARVILKNELLADADVMQVDDLATIMT